jgi:hypothetical protein
MVMAPSGEMVFETTHTLLFPSVNPWVKSTSSVRMLPVQDTNSKGNRNLIK